MLFIRSLIRQILRNRRHVHQKHYAEILSDTVFFNTVLQGHPNSQSWNTQLLRKSQNLLAYLAESNSWKHWESTIAFQNPKVGYLEDSTEVHSEKTKGDNGYKPKQWQFRLEIRKRFFTMRIINLWAGHPERLWNCQPVDFHDPAVQNLKQTALITVFVLLKQEADCSTDLHSDVHSRRNEWDSDQIQPFSGVFQDTWLRASCACILIQEISFN